MADDRKTYPRLPAKNWWTLRDRFRQSMPGKVDADYLQSVLGLTSSASASNLTGPLRTLGLVDDKGSPTDRALDWRDDAHYKDACASIASEVYPDTLRDAFPDPSASYEGVVNWFARTTRSGRGAATGMAGLYLLLASGDLSARMAATNAVPPKPVVKSNGGTKVAAVPRSATTPPTPSSPNLQPERAVVPQRPAKENPTLNINVQIHISADASADQIEQIFKSMATHLYASA
jgi:hypothetical protein